MVMMQIAPPLLSPNRAEELLRGLDEETRRRVERLLDKLDDTLSLVGRVESAEQADAVLTVAALQYLETVTQTVRELTESGINVSEWTGFVLDIPAVLRELIEDRRDLFGNSSTEILLSSIESFEGFLEWAVETEDSTASEKLKSDYKANRVFLDFLKATVALYTCAAIANGRISDWKTEAISLLAVAADAHMERVEDRFLASVEPVNTPEDRVSAASVLQKLANIGL